MSPDLLAACRTPHKIGKLLLAPTYREGDFDSTGIDCPFPFAHEGLYFMTYIGWDRMGYRTGLASSDDLLTWRKEGLIIDRGPAGSVTEYNVAMTCILRDNELHGPGTLRKINGHYLGTYHAYPGTGYESGPAVIGLCWSDDLRKWQIGPPILRPEPSCSWEAGGLYKSWIMEHDGTYYLFYNAKDRGPEGKWIEQTGVAISRDLKTWERSPLNPVLPNGAKGEFDDIFASDPMVLRHEGKWILFYFGNCSDGHARDGVAFSDDLLHWEKSGEVLVDHGAPGSVDASHAHKPGIITRDGKLYHFYGAVSPIPGREHRTAEDESRGISLATS